MISDVSVCVLVAALCLVAPSSFMVLQEVEK